MKQKLDFRDLISGGSVSVLDKLPADIAAPFCPHGSMVLFRRQLGVKDKSKPDEKEFSTIKSDKENEVQTKEFFSCSAYRDRKLCNYFYPIDDKRLKNQELMTEKAEIAKSMNLPYDHKALYQNYKELSLIDSASRKFCRKCNLFMKRAGTTCQLKDVSGNDHAKCESEKMLVSGIPESLIENPLKLFTAMDNKTAEAQFYFKTESLGYLKTLAEKYTHVLGIGAPSVLFRITEDSAKGITETQKDCFCLDIDWKLSQIFSPKRFAQFNMCNQHFFTDLGQKLFDAFVKRAKGDKETQTKTLVVIDPPYGVKVELIGQLVTFIESKFTCKVILCMPYFMEGSLSKVDSLKQLKMSDYRIEYDNHRIYSGVKKRGSPARFFTNISLKKLQPPNEQDYKLCAKCSKYVHKTNKHCKICKSCTTKDGETYVHCKVLGACVKPSLAKNLPIAAVKNVIEVESEKTAKLDTKKNLKRKFKDKKKKETAKKPKFDKISSDA